MNYHKLYEITPIENLKDLLYKSKEKFSEKTAFIKKSGNGSFIKISYNKVLQDVNALGSSLLKLGLKDKFIAVLGENNYEWCISYLSVVCVFCYVRRRCGRDHIDPESNTHLKLV